MNNQNLMRRRPLDDEELDASISKLRKQIHELKVQNKRTNLLNVSSRQKMQKHLDDITNQMKQKNNNCNSTTKSLTPYLQTIRTVMGTGAAPTYVQSLEAKVCQALHRMAIGNDQLSRFDQDCHKQILELKSESVAMREESSTGVTLDLMNQISQTDDSNHTIRMAYLRVLQAQCVILRALDMQVVTLTVADDDVDCGTTINAQQPQTPISRPRRMKTRSTERQEGAKESNTSISSPTSVTRTAMLNDQDWLHHSSN